MQDSDPDMHKAVIEKCCSDIRGNLDSDSVNTLQERIKNFENIMVGISGQGKNIETQSYKDLSEEIPMLLATAYAQHKMIVSLIHARLNGQGARLLAEVVSDDSIKKFLNSSPSKPYLIQAKAKLLIIEDFCQRIKNKCNNTIL